MLKPSIALANALAAYASTQLNLGFLYVFAGPAPATADDALDLVAVHTEIVKISNNATDTGLTFAAPAAGVLPKAAAEVWSGVIATSGFQGAEVALAPTFYRLCAAGDNGRLAANASTGYRIQGTAGGPNSGAELQFGTATLTEGNTQPVGAFGVNFGA